MDDSTGSPAPQAPPGGASAPAHGPPPEPREADKQLSAALRRLIRDELGPDAAPPQHPPQPTLPAHSPWRENVLVLVLIGLAVFGSHWVPHNWFTSDQIEAAKYVGTFFSGAIVFARPEWLRDHIIAIGEKRGILETLLVVFALVFIARFAAFRFELRADPPDAVIALAGKVVRNGAPSPPLSIDEHEFSVTAASPNDSQKPRKIVIGSLEMIFRFLSRRTSLYWPLIQKVNLSYPCVDRFTLKIHKAKGGFDPEYLQNIGAYQQDAQPDGDSDLTYSPPVDVASDDIFLPWGGTYDFTLTKRGKPAPVWQASGRLIDDKNHLIDFNPNGLQGCKP